MKDKEKYAEHFIVALREHRILGYVFSPYLAWYDSRRNFWSVKEPLNPVDIDTSDLHEKEQKLVQITGKYNDSEIFRVFGKRRHTRAKSVQEFYNQLSPGDISDKIRPYVETQMAKAVDLLRHSDIPVFFKDRNYDNLYNNDSLQVHVQPAETVFHFARDEQGIRYALTVYHNNTEKSLTDTYTLLLCHNPAVLLMDDGLFVFRDIDGKKLQPFFNKNFVRIPKSHEETYFKTFVQKAIRHYRVQAGGFTIKTEKPSRYVRLSLEVGLDDSYVFNCSFVYGAFIIRPNDANTTIVKYTGEKGREFIKVQRDITWEQQMDAALRSKGMERKHEFTYYPVAADGQSVHEVVAWLNAHRKELDKLGLQIVENTGKRYFTGNVELQTKVRSKTDWFDIYAVVFFGEHRVPFYKLRKHILNERREYKLPDGSIAILPESWFARYAEILALAEGDKEHLYLKKHHFALVEEELSESVPENTSSYKQLLNQSMSHDVEKPGDLHAELRSYQQQGFAWLYFLYQQHFGGCLADDMGLGKTLQALTLLLKVRKEVNAEGAAGTNNEQLSLFGNEDNGQQTHTTSLIVMPTSLLHNWHNEIRKFAPSLRVMQYVGQRTGKIEQFSQYDIILTSYGIVRNDYRQLKEFEFLYLILDESQYIKNPGSKIYKAIEELDSYHRMVLTGTPIENSLTDLWAQLNFLNQGLLGSYNYFRENFVIPIERYKDEAREDLLQALIKPFLLRRRKADVAGELPPVTEQVIFCDLTPEQRQVYDRHKSRIRNQLLQDIEEGHKDTSNFLILKSLTELRQLSNHPRMLDEKYEGASGKFNEIIRAMESLRAEGHKVIVFSSFVKHLNLIGEYLDEQDYQYLKLTGATRDRQEVVRSFQEDPQQQIFLMSLKAGGVGLNLTAASYVFIIDPWWNPATEMQAVNRAHRIGQDKKVFVYRFISQDTIEQKIQNLQKRKSDLADTFVNSNDPFQKLTLEEIKELMQ